MDKEKNKSILIAQLTKDNQDLKATITHLNSKVAAYEALIGDEVLSNISYLMAVLEEIETKKAEYEAGLEEIRMFKAQNEADKAEVLREIRNIPKT